MQALEATVAATANPWPLRLERATELAARYLHAAEMLHLYQALVPVQEKAFLEARDTNPEDVVEFALGRVMPAIVDATVSAGPPALRDAVISVFSTANLVELVNRWLAHESLDPFETYLTRASTSPVLEALATAPSPNASNARIAGSARLARAGRRALPTRGREISDSSESDRRCPWCGGLPQLSYFGLSGEALVTGPRYLVCSRCAGSWSFSRMTCAGCGEATGARLPIFQEREQFPHVRVDGCKSCNRYLLTFDLRREPRAVPIVDELAALPLDLYAIDQGLTKITPNLLGS